CGLRRAGSRWTSRSRTGTAHASTGWWRNHRECRHAIRPASGEAGPYSDPVHYRGSAICYSASFLHNKSHTGANCRSWAGSMGNPGMRLLDRPRRLLHEWSTRRKNQRTIDTLDEVLASHDPILLVHQMGRAGSMTTVNTLRGAGLDLAVFHTHWLNPASVQKRQDWVKHLPESRQPRNIRISTRIRAHPQP